MNFLDIKTSVYENFSDFHLSKGFTLAESECYDSFSKSFSEYSKDDLYVKLRKSYNDDIAHFITSNMVENKYIEPFESWSEIPLWYYHVFTFGGIVNLNDHNFIYYLSGFMNVILSNNIDSNNSDEIMLSWYDYLNYSYYGNKLSKELNHNQLKTIALFLCCDPETKEIDLSPPSADDDSFFATFWYSFLK